MIKKSLVAIAVLLLFAARGAYADCSFQIDVADSLGFPVNAMTAESSCGTVSVTLTHTGSLPKQAMGHNWVLTRSADFQAVAPAGMSAGVAGNYVPAGDARVIANTKLIGGGESDTVEFSLDGLAPGDYTFYCSFPGHWSAMKGTFTITAS